MSAFRHRGVRVVVDTTAEAEFDRQGYGVPDAVMERIADRLSAVTFSPEDRTVGAVRVRVIEGLDVIFLLTREGSKIVVTIGGVRPHQPGSATERLIRSVGLVGAVRSALGF
ncbi:MAG: hypothetical protein AAF677_11200 [Pseudomonadota bacterium]